MAKGRRQSLTFAPGTLTETTAVVRVRCDSWPQRVDDSKNICFAVLAEGAQWEVRVSGGPFGGTWYVDVPESCRDLSPTDRMTAVDKIMRRIAGVTPQTILRAALPAGTPLNLMSPAARIA